MKYVLGLLFEYKRYKKNARIRIFSDDVLVDEITLDQDIGYSVSRIGKVLASEKAMYDDSLQISKADKETFIKINNECLANLKKCIDPEPTSGAQTLFSNMIKKQMSRKLAKLQNNIPVMNPPGSRRNYEYIEVLPNKLFLFELEIDNQKTVRIEVSNEDNNYSNGFMTKSSTITFSAIFVLPSVLLAKQKKLFDLLARFYKNSLFQYFRTVNFNDQCYTRDAWPIVPPRAIRIKATKKYNIDDVYHNAIGGSFDLDFNLFKKNQLVVSTSGSRPKGRVLVWREIIDIINHFNLLNIYNEDQRSNHTKD